MTKVVTTIVTNFPMLRKIYGKVLKKPTASSKESTTVSFQQKAGVVRKIPFYQIMQEFNHIT